jgi:hypothetical protein
MSITLKVNETTHTVGIDQPMREVLPELGAPGYYSNLLGRQVRTRAVPRETWGAVFKAQGMRDPLPRIQMLDGFNEGWIRFEGGSATRVQGSVSLNDALGKLVADAA